MKTILLLLLLTGGGLICILFDVHPIDRFNKALDDQPYDACITGGGFIAWIPTTTQSWQCGHLPK